MMIPFCSSSSLLHPSDRMLLYVPVVSGKEAQMQRLMAVNSEIDICYNFTVGDRNKGEFYSPMYPNNYPNNTECIALITGQSI